MSKKSAPNPAKGMRALYDCEGLPIYRLEDTLCDRKSCPYINRSEQVEYLDKKYFKCAHPYVSLVMANNKLIKGKSLSDLFDF